MISQLETACDDQKEVDIHAMFTRLTLDIIGISLFSLSADLCIVAH